MKIAVMGAGAVGCYYGAMLALAGHQVTLIGRPALVEAVSANGLILEKAGARHVCAVQASTDPSAITGAQMVLFCVKSGDTAAAGAQIAPYLGDDTLLLSLQNGISNPETLEHATDHKAIAAVVYMASAMVAPGVVRHEGRGELAIGGPDATRAAETLNAAQIQTEVSANVMGLLWGKLLINCAYNAISAIARMPYGTFYAVDGLPQLIEDITAECLAVARAEGVTLPEGTLQTIRNVPGWMPAQYSSTAQDVMRGRPTEIDFLNGEILRRAARHGIDVPINRTLTLLTKLAEMQ
ncbi:2-dehydropantoate 2-reductase [Thalassobius vesicularis]|uniref:2-dehydropantoate 2-reductase n=1 Tax=Thalassobius vesicularis TaxID=1294297 RepID=A0A4V3UZ24_9RHOB|nr:2-dehydropantoate 2-reductase [Thalassobius vesicularis]THD74067.1 2-dehydropantoate 2-reductase [Thalassobius vesicularis]